MNEAKYIDDFEHVKYDFMCACPRCKSLMKELEKYFCCMKCGTIIDKETNEIK